MSQEKFTEQILVESYGLGILNEVLELATYFCERQKLDRHEAFEKAFYQLKKVGNKK